MTDCLVCAALNEMCLPLMYSTRRVLSVCLLAGGINTIISGQTHLVISQMLMDSLVFFQPSPTPLLSLSALQLISSICHPPPHYTVMTLPFHLISALSLPLPWLSSWSSRKRAISPPLLPSRSVSCRQHAIIPFCSILARLPATQRELVIRCFPG